MIRDFTLDRYEELCEEIVAGGYDVLNVNGYVQGKVKGNVQKDAQRGPQRGPQRGVQSDSKSDYVIIRHDVDSRPQMALKMARIERSRDIFSTYYFRFVKGIFDPAIIREISDLGHEIGYHYEVLSKAGGDFKRAIGLFEYELAQFRKICIIDTICMHGSVLSKYDNRDLWRIYDYRDFDISAEAYLSLGNDLCYLSDTGWEWNKKHKLRDLMPIKEGDLSVKDTPVKEPSVNSTSELLDVIHNNKINRIYLLVHPGNWTDNFYDWYYIMMKNKFFNAGKSILRLANGYNNNNH